MITAGDVAIWLNGLSFSVANSLAASAFKSNIFLKVIMKLYPFIYLTFLPFWLHLILYIGEFQPIITKFNIMFKKFAFFISREICLSIKKAPEA